MEIGKIENFLDFDTKFLMSIDFPYICHFFETSKF